MQGAEERISNMASVAKEHLTMCQAKVEEKMEKASARTYEEKQMAKERRKAKEARAKMELHQAKARHAAEKLNAKQSHYPPGHHLHHPPVVPTHGHVSNEPVVGTHAAYPPVGTTPTMAGTTYPLGGHPPGRDYI